LWHSGPMNIHQGRSEDMSARPRARGLRGAASFNESFNADAG
jgi:hypothetical protein